MKYKCVLLTVILFTSILYSQNKGLNSYNFSSMVQQLKLNNSLTEISGLAFAGDKLFAHNDEQAVIYQLDINLGKIIKRFSLGNPVLTGDFEGLAFGGGKFYLITSDGIIYSFSETKDGATAQYKKINTGINKSNIEGLCYDQSANALLIACKGNAGKEYKGQKVIYSFDLKQNKVSSKPKFIISEKEIEDKYGIKKLALSGVEKNNKTGTYFVLSSNDKAVIELSAEGKVISFVKLDEKKHNQPEGISFTPDGSLLISDEGAMLTRYALKK